MTTLIKLRTLTNNTNAPLLHDAVGMVALVVMLVVGLHLPVLV